MGIIEFTVNAFCRSEMVSSGKEKGFAKLFIENLMKSKIKLDGRENYPITLL